MYVKPQGGALPQPLGILAAMAVEGQAIEAALAVPQSRVILGRPVVSGLLKGHRVLLAYGGVGKVNAALAVAALADAGAAAIVLVGTAGGLAAGLKTGDAVVATDLIQHDVDVTAFGRPAGFIDGEMAGGSADADLSDRLVAAVTQIGQTVRRGRIASGDQFVASQIRSREIADQFDAVAVEMEGAAAAQAARQLGLPLAVLRWVSDGADDQAADDFPKFLAHIADLDLAAVKAMIV